MGKSCRVSKNGTKQAFFVVTLFSFENLFSTAAVQLTEFTAFWPIVKLGMASARQISME